MNRGPKLKSPAAKKLAGTYKDCVDGTTTSIVQLTGDKPVAPGWLSAGAKQVWSADIARLVECGAREADSHFVAIYCEMMARFVASAKAGEPLNAAFVSELRKQMEMLGIAGAKARLSRTASGGDAPKVSPFSIRPK